MSNPKEHIKVVSAAIMRDGRYLITQRMKKAVLPELWEFPGGKVEQEEADAGALERELVYRLGLNVTIGELLSTVVRDYTNYKLELHLYACDIGSQKPQALQVQDLAWVDSQHFNNYRFTPADEDSMNALLFASSNDGL
jgi:8-oxo-dGTP diphosphatase